MTTTKNTADLAVEDNIPSTNTPLVVLPSGVYFRPENLQGMFLTGVSPDIENDPDCEDSVLDHVNHDIFDNVIWPSLYEYVPAFGEIKVKTSWSGFYDMNLLDQNAIIGYHPDIENLVLANGFSGHGLQVKKVFWLLLLL